MTRIISVIGGKGGIGKTTLVSNLSSSLASLGHSVVAIDTNMTTPNLGLHLGMHLSPKSLHDVLKGRTQIHQAAYPHPSGFRVVPGSMSTNDLRGVDIGRLPSAVLSLYGKADYIILDSAAGLGREALSSLQSAEEILVITNPDMPSVADALKTVKLAEDNDKRVMGVVLNRTNGESYQLSREDVEKMLGYSVISEIPEDRNIPKSISMKVPLSSYDPNSNASIEFNRLAHNIAGKEFNYRRPIRLNLVEMLVGWISR